MSRGIRFRLRLMVGFLPVPALAQGIVIDHKPIGCVEAGKFPSLEARFGPEASVARARIYFRADGSPAWYSVLMKKEGASFHGVLPKPGKKMSRFDYYISVLDPSFAETRTPEYTSSVVSGATACGGKEVMAVGLAKTTPVIVSGPEGIANAPLVPAGFGSEGASAGAGAATAAAGGGGIGSTALVAGGVAVAGGITAVVVAKGEEVAATYSGEFAGIATWNYTDCQAGWRHSGTLRLELRNTRGDLSGSEATVNGGTVLIASTTCPPSGFLGVGASWSDNMPLTPVTGSLAALEFTFTRTTPATMNAVVQQVWTFSGSGSSDAINGTLTKRETQIFADGSRQSASVSMLVTLKRQP